MNAFRFLHTSDWHLGRPFAGFEASVADRLRQARRDSISACADVARQVGIQHILVAGDVFDARDVNRETWKSALTLMEDARDIRWHLIPGNHDYYEPGNVWDLVRQSAPKTVSVYLKNEPVEIADGVLLLPSPLVSRSQVHDPTAWMTAAETPSGALRIGLAHGSIDGTGGATADVPIGADAARTSRLDYLALGDWHGCNRIDARTWYSGTPEPDDYADNGAGQILAVTVRSDSAPVVDAHAIARHQWLSETATGGDALDAASRLTERVGALGGKASQALARLQITGPITLEEDLAVRRTMEEIAARVMVAVVDDRKARLTVDRTESHDLALDPTLGPVVERLVATLDHGKEAPDDSEARVASEALRLLSRYADALPSQAAQTPNGGEGP